jgi:hypothetical protein
MKGWHVGCALAAMSLLIGVTRLGTLHEPLEADLVTYATIGHELVSGKRLYTDVWDVKPPGLYQTYALAERLAGYGDREVWLLGVAAAIATLFGVYAAGAARGRTAGLVAALFWTALNRILVIQANQPNSEVFLNACYVAAFALLTRHPGLRRAPLRALAVGSFLALGSLYKPNVVLLAGLLAAAHVLAPPRGLTRTAALAEVAVMAAPGLVAWALIFAYAAGTGQGEIYWLTNVAANRHRGAGLAFNLYRYVREGKVVPRGLIFILPLVAFIVVGAVVGLRRGPRRAWILLIALQAGVHFMILAQGGAFHPHSYQLWLPTLSVGAGWAARTLAEAPWPRDGVWRRRLAGVAAALALAVVVAHEAPNALRPPDDWARQKYGEDVVEDPPFARAVAALLRPSETLFQYGDGAAFYYYGHLRPTTPTLWCMHLMDLTPLARRLGDVTLARLLAAPPDLFVVTARALAPPEAQVPTPGLAKRILAGGADVDETVAWRDHPIYKWALQTYRPWRQDERLAVRSPRYELFVRRGSDLERRLAAPPADR